MADDISLYTLHFPYQNDTDILYGLIRDVQGKVRNIVNETWDVWPGASQSLANYAINEAACTGGIWIGGFARIDYGTYLYEMRIRATGTPNTDDIQIGLDKGFWTGKGNLFHTISCDNLGRPYLAAGGLQDVEMYSHVGVPRDFQEKLNWLMDRFMGKTILDLNTNELKVHRIADQQITKQIVSEAGDVQTVERAVAP